MGNDDDAARLLQRLQATLTGCGASGIAVSGGVDSMTLAFVAHRAAPAGGITMFHAVSPAVPPAATARVRAYAQREGWTLEVIDAGEFSDERYLANPVDRCFYCKTHLYDAIAGHTGQQILSGTNLDDLSDFRPGLKAAAAQGVRHPFVEAGIDKAGVRAIARAHGLDIAELPASPCLSSRVETGIRIEPRRLRFVDAAERLVRDALRAAVVRCRIRAGAIVVELDGPARAALEPARERELVQSLAALYEQQAQDAAPPIRFDAYRMGSAFVGGRA